MSGFGHGSVGTREQEFTNLLDLREEGYPTHQLVVLSESMQADPDPAKDGADPEENLLVPAGYTYFGQFVDHDLTFDNTSSLNPADAGKEDRLPSNLRTPRFDLDSLYGDGPDAQPFLYDVDGATLLFKDGDKNQFQTIPGQATQDLLRSPTNNRAIIGDKRNDENSIVCQIHLAFVKYHNAVVKKIQDEQPDLKGTALFNEARNQVRWTYQKLVVKDFLRRIVNPEVFADLDQATTAEERKNCYALYTEDKRQNLPREFVVAAYRFGHSQVRAGYRLNTDNRSLLNIFPKRDAKPEDDSLLGFDPLPQLHVIDDWARFFPNTTPDIVPDKLGDKATDEPNPEVRLQFAYKIDPSLVDPLTILPAPVLPTSAAKGGLIQEVKDTINPDKLPDEKGRPSLALLNLLRGNTYKVQGGQAIASALQEKCFPVEILDAKHLVTRNSVEGKDGFFKFNPIAQDFQTDTPLWFYILAEAQVAVVDAINSDQEFSEDLLLNNNAAKTQLGWVGGRIVAEVFYGLLDSDDESFVNAAPPNWKPLLGGDGKVIFANLLKFAGIKVGK